MKTKTFLLLFFVVFSLISKGQVLDAAVLYNETYAFFFKENTAVKYNIPNNMAEASGKISEMFPGITFRQIDAAVSYNNGKIYFFSNGQYSRFDIASGRADTGYPRIVNENSWSGLPTNISAAMNWPAKAYFFSANNYYRYNRNTDAADVGYPKSVSTTAWPEMGFTSIDAALAFPNGKCYFFAGNQYYRYDIATDKAEANYPRTINSATWPGLQQAFGRKSIVENNVVHNKVSDHANYSVSKQKVSLAPYYVSSNKTMIVCEHYAYPNPSGGVYLVIKQDFNTIIYNFDKNLNPQQSPVFLENIIFSDMHVAPDGTLAVLGGKIINNTYLSNYANTIAFLKIDNNGNVIRNVNVYGGNGHDYGDSWFDGRSRARITCNGSEYGMYFEVQQYFKEDDTVHNGDAFYVCDLDGNIKQDRTHYWTASHSVTVRTTCEQNGDFFTLTIGDAYPFGLQFYNRNTKQNGVVWPPAQDRITYAEVKSASAAGMLSFMDYNNGAIVALLSTTNKPNYNDGRPLDPLFMKLDKNGNILQKKWLEVSASANSTKIMAHRLGQNYLIAWTNSEGENFKIAKINANGDYIQQPISVNEKLGFNGHIIPLSASEIIWFEGDKNGARELDVYRLTLK